MNHLDPALIISPHPDLHRSGGILYFLNLGLTLWTSRQPVPAVPEFAKPLTGVDDSPPILDRWALWLAVLALLLGVTYGPTLAHQFATAPLNTPGYRVW